MSEPFLLRHVCQFMREQSPAGPRARFVLAGGEGDLVGYSEGARARIVCRRDSVVAGVDAHTAEITTEARFKVSARRRIQRLPWRTQCLVDYWRSGSRNLSAAALFALKL